MPRRRFVALATDAKPTYAAHAPVAARLWKRIGYDAVVMIHADGWASEFGQIVIESLKEIGAILLVVPTCSPLGVANSMRVSRLVAACADNLAGDDLVLTADADMYPLSRHFFNYLGGPGYESEDFVALRAFYNVWTMLDRPFDPKELSIAPRVFRLAMCYCGASAQTWREMMDLVIQDPVASLRKLAAATTFDETDLDERATSEKFLAHPHAQGSLVEVSPRRVWRKGSLLLVDPMDLPCLSVYRCVPRGLLRLGDMPVQHPHPDALDFIPPRFQPGHAPWWTFDLAGTYFPEEKDWLRSYRDALSRVLVPGLWS